MFAMFNKQNNKQVNPVPESIEYDFENVTAIADYFKQITGISFEKQTSILRSKLSSFCRTRQIRSSADCLQMVQSDPELEQALVNYLTTNESFFYREFAQIQTLVEQVKSVDGDCDILCLPCATGEEPYSIVMAALEIGITSPFRLVGVDISSEALARAEAGVYSARNVSKMPESLVRKYFTEEAGHYHIDASIKSRVRLIKQNLFSPELSQIGKFDFILSRNMLIYFEKETKLKAVEVLKTLLKDPSQPVLFGHADLY